MKDSGCSFDVSVENQHIFRRWTIATWNERNAQERKMRFDDCASIVHEWKGTDDDAMYFPYKRIFATRFLFKNQAQMNAPMFYNA